MSDCRTIKPSICGSGKDVPYTQAECVSKKLVPSWCGDEPLLHYYECDEERDEIGCATVFSGVTFRYKGNTQGTNMFIARNADAASRFSNLSAEKAVNATFFVGSVTREWSGRSRILNGVITISIGDPNDVNVYGQMGIVNQEAIDFARQMGIDVSDVYIGDILYISNVLLFAGNLMQMTLKECGDYSEPIT